MAVAAGTSRKDSGAFSYERIGRRRHRRCRWCTGRSLRFKWLTHVTDLGVSLARELRGYVRIACVVVIAEGAEAGIASHKYGKSNNNYRTPPWPALAPSIKKWNRSKQQGEQPRQNNATKERPAAAHHLQPLKHRQVIPFRPRDVAGIRRNRLRSKANRNEICNQRQSQNNQQACYHIHHQLPGIKLLRRKFGMKRILVRGTRRACLAKQENMRGNEGNQKTGQHKNM